MKLLSLFIVTLILHILTIQNVPPFMKSEVAKEVVKKMSYFNEIKESRQYRIDEANERAKKIFEWPRPL